MFWSNQKESWKYYFTNIVNWNSIISSFYYEKYGNRILGESITAIGRCGFGEEAFPIKLEIENILKCAEEEYEVPSTGQKIIC